MTMNPLPPQAYDKEVLAKAFTWLQTQPKGIKELATSSDVLVSLYIKAKLNGDAYLERPSVQNFKSELKSLAGIIQNFEPNEEKLVDSLGKKPASIPQGQHLPQNQAPNFVPPLQIPTPTLAPAQEIKVQALAPGNPALDDQSQAMIREVKELFNLSSESEALRLLISTGSRALKRL